MPDVTVAFCTRNRGEALRSALSALLTDAVGSKVHCKVLIVDDGALSATEVHIMADMSSSAGQDFAYVKKGSEGLGLYESRRLAVRLAETDLLLFLDDDCEIGVGYLSRLVLRFERHSDLVGLGGVDGVSLPNGHGTCGRVYARLFLLASKNIGQLSRTGMNYGQAEWRRQGLPFVADYLHGCNMAFRSSVLLDLPMIPWLTGHAPCEDLVLSAHAGRAGELLVDPGMPVSHICAPGGRGRHKERILSRLRASRRFSVQYHPCPMILFYWSVLGLFIKDIAKVAWASVDGRTGRLAATLTAYLQFVRCPNRNPHGVEHAQTPGPAVA